MANLHILDDMGKHYPLCVICLWRNANDFQCFFNVIYGLEVTNDTLRTLSVCVTLRLQLNYV